MPFYGDQILAVAVPEGPMIGVYVPLRPLCNLLQLSWGSQFRRTHEDEIMGEALCSVLITRTEGPARTYTCRAPPARPASGGARAAGGRAHGAAEATRPPPSSPAGPEPQPGGGTNSAAGGG